MQESEVFNYGVNLYLLEEDMPNFAILQEAIKAYSSLKKVQFSLTESDSIKVHIDFANDKETTTNVRIFNLQPIDWTWIKRIYAMFKDIQL